MSPSIGVGKLRYYKVFIFSKGITEMQQITDVHKLKTPKDYISDGRTHIFPSEASLQWFIRKNKNVLIQASALLCPTGRTLINVNNFDEVVYAVGTNALKQDSSIGQVGVLLSTKEVV